MPSRSSPPTPVLDDLALFLRVVELGAFAKVARELGVPTSTVSRTISRLEDALGARLLHRTTRALRVTAEGEQLQARIGPALRSLQEAVQSVESVGGQPRGRLRVTAPTDLGSAFIAEIVQEFLLAHPHVEIELVLTQRLVDLVREGFDLALRAGALADSSLIARRVGTVPSRLFAAPDYLARAGHPRSLDDLSRHELVLFRAVRGQARWALERGRKRSELEVRGRLASDDFAFVRAAVVAGCGIGLIPALVCARDVAEGRLVRVLAPWQARGAPLHVVTPSARHVPAKVSAFRDFVVARFAAVTLRDSATARRATDRRA